jgi:hypothetical protein
MSLALALTAMVLGVLTVLYGFTMGRLAHATASFTASDDAFRAANVISDTVRYANSCTTVTSGGNTGLKCIMPANATDRDGDGRQDTYLFTKVSRRGLEQSVAGRRVWYYMSDSTGAFAVSGGTVLWRAERQDDAVPLTADGEKTFAYVAPNRPRFPLVSSVSFNVDSINLTVTTTITASALTRADRTAGTEAANQSYKHIDTRTTFWRNWRT